MKKLLLLLPILSLLNGCANLLRDENAMKNPPSIHPALANGCNCRPPVNLEPMVLQAPQRLFSIESMYFEVDKAQLLPHAEPKLAEIIDSIVQLQPNLILIEGHTDSTASLEYNQALSIRRAETVKNNLIQRGILPNKIQIAGYGETQPISNNSTETGRQKNRRVEVTLQ